ncbi:antibiotic biosynthesis monooxygenase [Aureimonas sp. Leaf454]|uniref:putative quinol monooxygenase n=1 Tax=Aureimonas sp. Leaf454 TaxID=1736381 RepID=UPI0006F8E882|nr:antibiotic biosynthesis monooxygenase [Aureimonas sp. Leaf454]KQT47388.1 antibiotic biosynthesis monooxygenase [Aureimonas sp. Leaf454]
MKTISAIIRVKAGAEAVMRRALLDVAAHVAANEPETIDFFVSQDGASPRVFTTYERFANAAAMDRHNSSAAVAVFFSIAEPLLDGEVILVAADEISAKTGMPG